MARPATISIYLMAIFLTKCPCLVKICIRDRSLPRSQTTNFPLVFITATFLIFSFIMIPSSNQIKIYLGYHNCPSSLPATPN